MRSLVLLASAFAFVLVLAGCNTQNAEPPPRQKRVTAMAERVPGPRSAMELPPGHPPIATGPTISGRISMAPGFSEKVSPGAVLFVIARRSGFRPPVAVVRLQGVFFPASYTIGPQDVMTPLGRFEGALEISARLDRDGIAGPPEPGDLGGAYPNNPVSVGDRNVDFMLDKPY